jgi:predicted AAA+ superfamily ATPase
MVQREFWKKYLIKAWGKRSVIWLSGVRRVGKTTLCKSFSDIEYFDCELPRVRRMLEDPEGFLQSFKGKRIVLDEIHRLSNPSEILKIAADHYRDTLVIATGSSTLGATKKFRDTLTGRKTEVWLMPMIREDLMAFGNTDMPHRFLSGGLPPFFLNRNIADRDFEEWMDSYWAKDITELFHLERRASFLRFAELLLTQSGGIFEATRFARACEVSRGTIANYLAALEATFVAHVIRPFSTHRPSEIVAAPKVYGFDTGFVCHYRGWQTLRQEDFGSLWEHFVLNEIVAHGQTRGVQYWRDKRVHEIDFVLPMPRTAPVAIECKWSADTFDPAALRAFRAHYSVGKNYVVSFDIDRPFVRGYGDNLSVEFVNVKMLIERLFSRG